MSTYLVARFLHMAGALAVLAALGIDLVALRRTAAARTADEARTALRVFRVGKPPGGVGMLVLLLTGAYMVEQAWGLPAWIDGALIALAAVIAVGAGVTNRALAAIESALTRAAAVADVAAVEQRLPRLWGSFVARALLLAAIVVLMAVKPGWAVTLLTLALAVVVAVAAAVTLSLGARRTGGAATQDARG